MRDWIDSSWYLAFWTVPVPGIAFGGMLLPGDGDRQWVLGLVLAAAASLALVAVALRRAGWAWPRGTLLATAAGLLGTVGVALGVASQTAEADWVLGCTVLGLPHVALAGLAWPGGRGLVLRVAVATLTVVPAGLLAVAAGFATLLVLGPLGIALGVAVGHALVLVAGTVVAPPVALRRVARPVAALIPLPSAPV